MLKKDEVTYPNSCLNKAADGEMIFVLREKDAAMAGTIRDWVERRLRLGLNQREDRKIMDALDMVAYLEGKS